MEEEIKNIIKEDIEKEGFEIVEVKCSKFKGRTNISVFLDKTGGITLEDCEKANGIISFLLDGSNLNLSNYNLEVSSPGLDRPLKDEKDFKKHLGETVLVNLLEVVNDNVFFEGKLVDVKDGEIEILVKEKNIKIPIIKISKAKVKIQI
jgi:ribosome maturation factor RimP